MAPSITIESLELVRHLRKGNRIIVGQACGEPVKLVEALIAQVREIGGVSVFTGSSFSGLFTPEAANEIELCSMGALGSLKNVARAGKLSIIPIHMSQIGMAIETGTLACDVAMIQVSPADEHGYHSCGLTGDHVSAAVRKARLVIAEVNEAVPFTHGEVIHASEIDVAIPVDYVPVEFMTTRGSEVEVKIANYCASFIGDGAVLQIGIGALPNAVLRQLSDRRDLGLHSGLMSDGCIDLVEAGIMTNARKEIDVGKSVASSLVGSQRLYRFAHRNKGIRICADRYTHSAEVLARLSRLVTVNSALEVDLSGQVNAEVAGGAYIGAAGGQVDFIRAGARSPGGRGIVALPSTAKHGSISRIVSRLGGPVTTSRADADVIVTEYGTAELQGRSLKERARRLIAIAHPAFREHLSREAHRYFQ